MDETIKQELREQLKQVYRDGYYTDNNTSDSSFNAHLDYFHNYYLKGYIKGSEFGYEMAKDNLMGQFLEYFAYSKRKTIKYKDLSKFFNLYKEFDEDILNLTDEVKQNL